MRTLSVLYRDKDDTMIEYHIGNESTETKARNFAWTKVAEGATNVVIRCTYPDDQNPHITYTAWSEPINSEPTPDIDEPTNPTRECLNDLTTYTIPHILLDIDRAELRGEALSPAWFYDQVRILDKEMSAVL